MSSNEEYLDNLLKSMGGAGDETASSDNAIMSPEEIEAMFAAAEKVANGEEPEEPEARSTAQPEEALLMEEPEAEKEPEALEKDSAAAPFSEESHTVESTQELSQEEIEQLLRASGQFGNEASDAAEDRKDGAEENLPENAETEDLISLLGSLSDDEELSEIGELLEKSDNNEPVDVSLLNLLEGTGDGMAEESTAEGSQETEGLTAEDGRKRKKKVPKEKKPKKEKAGKVKKFRQGKNAEAGAEELSIGEAHAEGKSIGESGIFDIIGEGQNSTDKADIDVGGSEKTAAKEKKSGFFTHLFSVLTQEDETEEKAIDENRAIMQELEEEDLKAANKKKKLKKGKKPAKGKPDDTLEDDGEEAGKAKKKKAPKAAKQKKIKTPKPEQTVAETSHGRRISKKSIGVVVLFAATVFAAIWFSVSFLSDFIRLQNAKAAFDKQDYMTCYQEMYGMNLSEEENKMFHHAEIVLKMQRRITIYEKYMKEDKVLLALDSLMRAIAGYDEIYGKAQNYGAASEVAAVYNQALIILEENYGLTQDEARAIALCDSNVEYTKYLTALSEGKRVSADGSTGGIILPETEVQDILPAEEELQQPGFAD